MLCGVGSHAAARSRLFAWLCGYRRTAISPYNASSAHLNSAVGAYLDTWRHVTLLALTAPIFQPASWQHRGHRVLYRRAATFAVYLHRAERRSTAWWPVTRARRCASVCWFSAPRCSLVCAPRWHCSLRAPGARRAVQYHRRRRTRRVNCRHLRWRARWFLPAIIAPLLTLLPSRASLRRSASFVPSTLTGKGELSRFMPLYLSLRAPTVQRNNMTWCRAFHRARQRLRAHDAAALAPPTSARLDYHGRYAIARQFACVHAARSIILLDPHNRLATVSGSPPSPPAA